MAGPMPTELLALGQIASRARVAGWKGKPFLMSSALPAIARLVSCALAVALDASSQEVGDGNEAWRQLGRAGERWHR